MRLKVENFYGEGARTALSLDPSPLGRKTPPPHRLTPTSLGLGAFGVVIVAHSALPLASAALDHWVPPRLWKSGYKPL